MTPAPQKDTAPAMTPAPLTLATSRDVPQLTAARGFIQLNTLEQAKAFAEILVRTDMVPKDYRGPEKVGNAIVAMQMGAELGLPPLQALQNIAVINGRPGVWGDVIPAIVLSQPDCEDFVEEKPEGEDPKAWVATCRIKRRGFSETVVTFTWADAVRAKLAGKEGPWQQYPKRQMQMRARGFAARDAYPDRLKGLGVREELLDYPPEAEKNVTPPRREPQRVSQAAAPAIEAEPVEPKTGTPEPPTPPAAGIARPDAVDVLRQVQLLDGLFVPGAGNKAARWEVSTNQGTVYVLDEAIYQSIETCFGTDHRFALTVKFVKASTGLARIVTQLDVEDGGTA